LVWGKTRVTGVVGEFTQAMVVRAAAGVSGTRAGWTADNGGAKSVVGQVAPSPPKVDDSARVALAPMKLQDVLILS